VDERVGRQHGQSVTLGTGVHHRFGQLMWRKMFRNSNIQRSESQGVFGMGVPDAGPIEKIQTTF
jgi:hypothetical protein